MTKIEFCAGRSVNQLITKIKTKEYGHVQKTPSASISTAKTSVRNIEIEKFRTLLYFGQKIAKILVSDVRNI